MYWNKKSQAAVTDLFIAIAIFITLVTVTTTMWNLYNAQLNSRVSYDDMVVRTFQISDILLKTPGEPAHWETFDTTLPGEVTKIRYIGLVDREKHIPYEKAQGLQQLWNNDQAAVIDLFHVGLYNFAFRIIDGAGDTIFQIGNFGTSAKFSVNLARAMTYTQTPGTAPQPVIVEVLLSK